MYKQHYDDHYKTKFINNFLLERVRENYIHVPSTWMLLSRISAFSVQKKLLCNTLHKKLLFVTNIESYACFFAKIQTFRFWFRCYPQICIKLH